MAAPNDSGLAALAGSPPQGVLVDQHGKEHRFSLVLDITDMVDYERDHGSLDGLLDEKKSSMESFRYILWLLLRKEGKSEAELDRCQWAYSLLQVGRLFSVHQITDVAGALRVGVKASEWAGEEEPPAGNPPVGVAADGAPSTRTSGPRLPSSSGDTRELALASSGGSLSPS